MPKVKMMAGIASISGKFGNMYFRTDKKSGRVSLCNSRIGIANNRINSIFCGKIHFYLRMCNFCCNFARFL